MATIGERCRKLLDWAQGAAPELPSAVMIPAGNVIGGSAPPTLASDQQYFKVLLNQLYLAEERKWFTTWDPLALVVTEFLYGGKRTMLPFIVGRSTFEKLYGHALPGQMLFDDTLVAGWHPYKGGQIDLTVVLYRIKRDDHARTILGLAEKASALFLFGSALDLYLEAAEVVLDGLEAVLGLADTNPVIGRRHGLHPAQPTSIGSGFFALVDADVQPDELWIRDNQLHWGTAADDLEPFAEADFLLYSLASDAAREDVDALPFGLLLRRALVEAQNPAADSKARAKAAMATAFAAIVDSGDVTWDHGLAIRGQYRERLVKGFAEADALAHLAAPPPDDLRRAAALLDAANILDL